MNQLKETINSDQMTIWRRKNSKLSIFTNSTSIIGIFPLAHIWVSICFDPLYNPYSSSVTSLNFKMPTELLCGSRSFSQCFALTTIQKAMTQPERSFDIQSFNRYSRAQVVRYFRTSAPSAASILRLHIILRSMGSLLMDPYHNAGMYGTAHSSYNHSTTTPLPGISALTATSPMLPSVNSIASNATSMIATTPPTSTPVYGSGIASGVGNQMGESCLLYKGF